jgi:hypothetical protein
MCVAGRLLSAVAFVAFVGTNFACSRSDSTGTPPARRSEPGTPDSSKVSGSKPRVARTSGVPSFRRDIAPVLEQTCTKADSCHGAVPAEAITMDLRPLAAYAELVNRPAQGRPGWVRVRPGDPNASFLIVKLVGPLQHGEGKRMPLDENTGAPAEPNPLPGDFVDQVLKLWIAAQAPDN